MQSNVRDNAAEQDLSGDFSVRENSLIELYNHLHSAGAVYHEKEEETLGAWQGLGCLRKGV